MEDKIYTTDELVDMEVYTSDFEFMDKACEVLGTLISKAPPAWECTACSSFWRTAERSSRRSSVGRDI